MEPIYIFIAVLSYIAAHLIYDSTIATRKAEKILANLNEKEMQLQNLFFKELDEIHNKAMNINDIDRATENLELRDKKWNEIYQKSNEIKDIELIFRSHIQKLPMSLTIKMNLKFNTSKRINKLMFQHENHHFFRNLRKNIMDNYQSTNIEMVKFVAAVLKHDVKMEMESIVLDDGTELNKDKVSEHLEKCLFNQKLELKLPPKSKTKPKVKKI